MALRSAITKISSKLLQNYCRRLSYKFDMTASRPGPSEHTEEPVAAVVEEQQEVGSHFRYNVCQERTTPKERPSSAAELMDPQRFHAKVAIEEQNLQPATMAEYYTPGAIAGPSRFQESKTRANVTLPLKQVKLANPFPEPVKQMMSRTVSDDEKAAQMLAESKSQRCFASDSGRLSNRPPQRSYSTKSSTVDTDPKKCKKIKGEKKQSCPRMTLPHCDPPNPTVSCERSAKKVVCKKQDAPYPAYSEFCHEEPDQKPSECKICPWKPEEHPTFKAPKKKFHTSAACDVRRTGLEEVDWTLASETGKKLGARELDREEFESEEHPEGMLCDLSKPPCVRPPRRPCADVGKKKGKKDKHPKDDKKKKKECISNVAQVLIKQNIVDVETEDISHPSETLSLKEKKDKKKGPCKKFKFPKCQPPKRSDQDVGNCPPKKHKPKIKDCPPDDTQCSSANTAEYQLSGDDGKRKCPNVDMTINRPEEDQDPCKLKRKGTTKICPGDLLKKKRRKPGVKKKTSGIIPPNSSSPNEPPRASSV